jgi:two-component system response regulator RegA
MALVDLRMPGRSGLELVAEAKRLRPAIRIVVLTGYGSIATASQAIKLGALYYLPKPADVDEILHAFAQDDELTISGGPEELTRQAWPGVGTYPGCSPIATATSRRRPKLNIHRRSLQRKHSNSLL